MKNAAQIERFTLDTPILTIAEQALWDDPFLPARERAEVGHGYEPGTLASRSPEILKTLVDDCWHRRMVEVHPTIPACGDYGVDHSIEDCGFVTLQVQSSVDDLLHWQSNTYQLLCATDDELLERAS